MAVPVNSVVPAITGTVDVGEQLTSSTGTWTGGVTAYAYQWQRSEDTETWLDISGADNDKYTLSVNDCQKYVRVSVIATNNSGDSLPAYSLSTIIVPDEWFVVEDGTAKSNAISFASNEAADAYHSKRGNTAWTMLLHTQKHGLLVKATDYMEQVYRERWKGIRVTDSQSLSWPRAYVEREDGDYESPTSSYRAYATYYYPSNVVPQEVINACCELALKAYTADLSPDIDRVTKREKLGPMEVEYQDYGKPYKTFRNVDNILSFLLKSSGSGVFRKLERV